jgi:hypothetical protein
MQWNLLAERAVWKMDQWMRDVVQGYHGLTRDERRSCADQLALHLVLGNCPCGLDRCPTRHHIAAQPASGAGPALFVEQAVIGPVGLCANSVAQGMFYQLILRSDYQMLVSNVEFKRCGNPLCANPYGEYEEDRCPGDRCDSVYSPDQTEVIAREWLVIKGVYQTVRRWCCGGTHYYRQHYCHGELVPPFTEVHYRLLHGPNGHDSCPWLGCPNDRPRHPQSPGSTLWVRAHLAEGSTEPTHADPLSTIRLDSYAVGTRQWLAALNLATASQLRNALAADPTLAAESHEDPAVIANWVLTQKETVVPATERARLREAINLALQERGLEHDTSLLQHVPPKRAWAMTPFNKRKEVSPLTAEQAAVFRRLVSGEGAVVTAEQDLVLRDPLLNVVVSGRPAEEADHPETAPTKHADEIPLGKASAVLEAVFQPGGPGATPEVLADLARLLGHTEAWVRITAARAVRYLGSRAATTAILAQLPSLLQDSSAVVRDTAAAALGSMGSAAATPAVIAAVASLVFDADWRVGAAAAAAVSRMGCGAAIEDQLRRTPPQSGEADGLSKNKDLFDVLISAYGPQESRVRLDGMALHARGQDEVGTILRIGRVTERGDLALDGLTTGVAFRLHSPVVWRRSGEPVRLPVRTGARVAAPADESPDPSDLPVYESPDGKVRGFVQPLPDGRAVVVFETNEASLAGAQVHFDLVQEFGRVEHSGDVRLDPCRDGLWEGQWTGMVSLAAQCELVFDVRVPE